MECIDIYECFPHAGISVHKGFHVYPYIIRDSAMKRDGQRSLLKKILRLLGHHLQKPLRVLFSAVYCSQPVMQRTFVDPRNS